MKRVALSLFLCTVASSLFADPYTPQKLPPLRVIEDFSDAFPSQYLATGRAVRHAHLGIEDTQIVIDLRHRSHRRSRAIARALLLDCDRGGDTRNQLGLWAGKVLEVAPRIGRERLDIAALPFGVDRIEGKRRLTRARDPREADELIRFEREANFLEVVALDLFEDDLLHSGGV